jgi:hypothetical protein
MKKLLLFVMFLFNLNLLDAQTTDSGKFSYNKVYSYALDANLKEALPLVTSAKPVTAQDSFFITNFINRFGKTQYDSSFVHSKDTALRPLLFLYSAYWRNALLDPAVNYDSALISRLTQLLQHSFPSSCTSCVGDSLNSYLKKYVESKGYYTTGYGRTGKLLDLLIWKRQTDTVYTLHKQKVTVVFLDEFYTLGWEEYATFGRYYPGGWATKQKLFCVRKAYDTNSEVFLVNYLAHEGQHFSDYKNFPKLTSAELEYRAKLVELTEVDKQLHNTITSFINNGKANGTNAHTRANFLVMSALSKKIFRKEIEPELSEWKRVKTKRIHHAAKKIFNRSTLLLKQNGHLFDNKN